MSAPRYPWWLEPAAFLGALVVRVLGATWRYTTVRAPGYAAGMAAGEKFVFCFWHSRILPLTYSRRGEGITVLVSRHRDGQLITRVIEWLGYTSARGSSTRGGEVAVREMLERAQAGHEIAITPDGPRGPAEVLKPGLVYVAARLGRRIVPIVATAESEWALRSWDRFRVPKPFTRIHVAYGEPVGAGAGDEAARVAVEVALRELTAANDRAVGDGA